MSEPRFSAIEPPDYPCEKIRQSLMMAGVEARYIDEIVDLACHAAASGRRSLLETVDRASNFIIGTGAIGIALSLLQHDCECLILGLRESAAKAGMPVHDHIVEGAV